MRFEYGRLLIFTKEDVFVRFMSETAGSLYMFNTCPFTWKVRALLDHLDLPHERVKINTMKIKKSVSFACDWGKTPVWKMSDGEVVVEGREYGYGNLIEISHGYGVVTRYGHNSKHLVKVGDRVRRGPPLCA